MTTPGEVASNGGSQDQGQGTPNVNRPIIMPDAYNGEPNCRWDQWIAHFESVAQINSWSDDVKTLWLQVRLTGKAQTAWERLDQTAKSTYSQAKAALRDRFEPSSKRDLYAAEFQARRRLERESWGDLADNLRGLADRAFPDLEDKAREQLSLNRFLSLIDKPTIALAVHQRHPKDLNEVVAYTLEAETHLSLTSSDKTLTASVTSSGDVIKTLPTENQTTIAAIQSTQNAMLEMLKSLTIRMEQMEKAMTQQLGQSSPATRSKPPAGSQFTLEPAQPIICRKCGKEGHFAKGCAARYGQRKQGN